LSDTRTYVKWRKDDITWSFMILFIMMRWSRLVVQTQEARTS